MPDVTISPTQMADLIKTASSRSWEAGVLCFVMLLTVIFLVWLVKSWMGSAAERENRMAKRIDDLENFLRDNLVQLSVQCKEALDKNTQAVANLQKALDDRTCLLDEPNRRCVVDSLVEAVIAKTSK